ncbi:MAG: MerR family transcriptional regulator [Chloroflexi bacterium]|nr:MerR family transcriptional regulator [Chloroflexota bacterium]
MHFDEIFDQDQPVFVISVAARMVGVQTQTLRYYERIGLIEPSRTPGNQRVFSANDVERVRQIRTLVDDMGVNLAGVEVVLKLFERIEEAEVEIESLKLENERLTGALSERS